MNRSLLAPLLLMLLFVTCARVAFRSESRKLHEELILAPMDGYAECIQPILRGDHYEAVLQLAQFYAHYPWFHLNGHVLWWLGRSLQQFGLFQAADSVFRLGDDPDFGSNGRTQCLFGIAQGALKRRSFDTLSSCVAQFRQRIPDYYLRREMDIIDALGHSLANDTYRAESAFVSISRADSGDYTTSVAILLLARQALLRGDVNRAAGHISDEIRRIETLPSPKKAELRSVGIYPAFLRGDTISCRFVDELLSVAYPVKVTADEELALLRRLLSASLSPKCPDENAFFLGSRWVDSMGIGRPPRSREPSIRTIISNLEDLRDQLQARAGFSAHF